MLAFKKSLYRSIRYNPWTEFVQNAARRESGVAFPEIDLFVPCGRGDVIIDAGANVGDITSRCARTGAEVHAFEPDPLCFSILRKRFASLANVRLYQAGLMDRATTFTLRTPKGHRQYDDVDSTVSASFLAPMPEDAETIETEVQCLDTADFIRQLGRPIALLKMDIEGAEIPVLNRLLDTGVIDRVEIAVVETHERLSPELDRATKKLKRRLAQSGLSDKIRLDWI